MSVELKTPLDVQHEMASRFKVRRLARNLTQEGLAKRAGVSWGSLKRFESTGLIALESLLKIALVLDCLMDFDKVCPDDGGGLAARSLDEILYRPKVRRKGRIK
jgi:transcriptional regulator with XRE-family HTH domain